MFDIRRIAMVGGTLACMAGIGVYIQSGDRSVDEIADDDPVAVAIDAAPTALQLPVDHSVDQVVLPLENIALTFAVADLGNPGPGARLPETPSDPESPELRCGVTASAVAAPSASVDLVVEAPCLGDRRVNIHHFGMVFTATTDATGRLNQTIPVLSERPLIVVDFGGGRGAVATAHVPDLHTVDRVVLQWQGAAGFQIHAREFGAGYGEPGHVWTGADDATGLGQIRHLGDPTSFAPNMVEIYTAPRGGAKAGTIAMSVEAEITSANCGKDVTAQTLQLRDGKSLRVRDVVLAMPNCSAVGDFLVLNNLVDDLKIAAR